MNSQHWRPSTDPMILLSEEMKLQGFSHKTVKSYTDYIKKCLKYTNKSPRNINQQDIKNFLLHLVGRELSASTLNTAYSALKYYFEKILRRKFFVNIPRVKKPKKLPTVLSRTEVKNLIENTKNPKHKCILSILYGSGIRVGELVKLKMENIDLERNIIHIISGKGAKSRLVILPETIRDTIKTQRRLKEPDDFLFTNGRGGRLTEASVQKVVKQAAERAQIIKNVSPHTLRHSFATHLLESGTSIRYIQALLGHARLETTQIYTRVAITSLEQIISPLDF
jgi:integrase/recombinase XerD